MIDGQSYIVESGMQYSQAGFGQTCIVRYITGLSAFLALKKKNIMKQNIYTTLLTFVVKTLHTYQNICCDVISNINLVGIRQEFPGFTWFCVIRVPSKSMVRPFLDVRKIMTHINIKKLNNISNIIKQGINITKLCIFTKIVTVTYSEPSNCNDHT
jgi:hypothetical protein